MDDAIDLGAQDKVHVQNSHLNTLDIEEEKPSNRNTATDLISPDDNVVEGKKIVS